MSPGMRSSSKEKKPASARLPVAAQVLRFGIPSLDFLLNPSEPHGLNLPPREAGAQDPASQATANLCIVGPSGTGKSLLALHLASRYYADCLTENSWEGNLSRRPNVLYASTDLSHARAQEIWEKFKLLSPNERLLPFRERLCTDDAHSRLHLHLTACKLERFDSLVNAMERPLNASDFQGEVLFFDLATSTAGDDWGFITRLVSLLRPMPYEGPEVTAPVDASTTPQHLLIIDAVEGLEMLVGETDAFGRPRSRRSRVAQILRAAAGRCHVCLVLEEELKDGHEPEEYVTDGVVRLRANWEADYVRRTVEVVKARGNAPIRGRHPYYIRKGEGTPTDLDVATFPPKLGEFGRFARESQALEKPAASDDDLQKAESGLAARALARQLDDYYNPDDPRSGCCYIHVVHSLDCLSRDMMKRTKTALSTPSADGQAPVARIQSPKLLGVLPARHGFVLGHVTVLTGDESTLKARLGRAFLAGCFQNEDDGFQTNNGEVAVLISTENESFKEIHDKLVRHDYRSTPRWREALQQGNFFADRLVHRQLEIHDLNSPILFHIVRRCVEKALEIAGKIAIGREGDLLSKLLSRPWCCPLENWEPKLKDIPGRVRVVIEDWSVIRSSFPSVGADAKFLPFLTRYLELMGVTTLIIDTQPGRPDQIFSSDSGRQLRSLARRHLFTWHVPFFGESRVAIAAIPPLTDRLPSVVHELRPGPAASGEHHEGERLWGDPHFELYRGLETGNPESVRLEVHLFAAAEAFGEFAARSGAVLDQVFVPQTGEHVIVPHSPESYTSLREFSVLHTSTRIGHTVVYQVDEYWRGPSHLDVEPRPERGYLSRRSVDRFGRAIPTNDPFLGYQPEPGDQSKDAASETFRRAKHSFFPVSAYQPAPWELKPEYRNRLDEDFPESWSRLEKKPKEALNIVASGKRWGDLTTEQKANLAEISEATWHLTFDHDGLVPYYWDFGFLLLRNRAWETAVQENAAGGPLRLSERARDLVRQVYRYCTGELSLNSSTIVAGGKAVVPVTWGQFLEASIHVARIQGSHTAGRIHPLDLDLLSPQTFACLVLEMWASEVDGDIPENCESKLHLHSRRLPSHPGGGQPAPPIHDWLQGKNHYRDELFRVFLYLGEAVDPQLVLDERGGFQTRRPSARAVAERHWFSTASQMWRKLEADDSLVPARLPGRYSTRGDWFLTVGRESRSQRLGERAVDLLCRRRMNHMRLELGVGLPVRDLLHAEVAADPAKRRRAFSEIEIALGTTDRAGFRRRLSFQELLDLGARIEKDQNGERVKPTHLRWLWRSQIKDYHLHDRILERWLERLLKRSAHWVRCLRSEGKDPFGLVEKTIFDLVGDARHGGKFTKDYCYRKNPSLKNARQEFDAMVDVMADEMRKLGSTR